MVLMFNFTTSFSGFVDAFRIWSNIYKWTFFAEIHNGFRLLTTFGKKSSAAEIFEWAENGGLAKGLKYWVYSFSKSINEANKILSLKLCVVSILKKQKVVVGQ